MQKYKQIRYFVSKMLLAVMFVAVLPAFGLFTHTAQAISLTFTLGNVGSVDYLGGSTSLTTTGGSVIDVGNGTTSTALTSTFLNFATGDYSSGATLGAGFKNNYSAGGSLTITDPTTTLLAGSFALPSSFTYTPNPTFGFLGEATFAGTLNISSIDLGLASSLGFTPPATGGSITQVDIFLSSPLGGGGLPTTFGAAFSGTQSGGTITVDGSSAPVPTPEPASLVLMGSGLIGLAFWRARRSKD